ncbi:HAD family hydrolase [Kribbella sandramycini]|uniref:Phosphoglycolate phosphatase-like HAD superfamily hydrolase n=1 Tax=Kribbella sandramycini TaxID=60450 RepID=A0A841S621_9ACTN|nr:phosphoglycolate phosphatase-like HAD superfamily hydrolase [Kribbella sandramycini]
MNISHVVWDWNGTLLNDNEVVLAAVNSVFVDFGGAAVSWAEWQAAYTRPMHVSYEAILGRTLDETEWARVDKLYHERYDALLATCGLAADAPDALRAVAESGRTQSLLSMWFHDRLTPTVEAFGLTPHFRRVDGLVATIGGGSKAESLQAHLEAQQLDPATVVLIGDVVDDADAATAAGAHCVLVTTGAMPRAALEATGHPVASTLAEALALLDRPLAH